MQDQQANLLDLRDSKRAEPAQLSRQGEAALPQLARHARTGNEIAHEDEQRHDRENVGEAGFEDLTALTQLKFPTRPKLELARRQSTFQEVVIGLDESTALYEARRCLSCGNCFECDGCLGACPEDAVIKLGVGHRYRFDYDSCTGCGTCYVSSMSKRVICPVFTGEVSAHNNSTKPEAVPKRSVVGVDAGGQGEADLEVARCARPDRPGAGHLLCVDDDR